MCFLLAFIKLIFRGKNCPKHKLLWILSTTSCHEIFFNLLAFKSFLAFLSWNIMLGLLKVLAKTKHFVYTTTDSARERHFLLTVPVLIFHFIIQLYKKKISMIIICLCTYLVSQNTATEKLSDPSASCVSIKSLTFSIIIDDFYGANTSGRGSSRVPRVLRPCRHNSNPRDQSEALLWAFLLATMVDHIHRHYRLTIFPLYILYWMPFIILRLYSRTKTMQKNLVPKTIVILWPRSF